MKNKIYGVFQPFDTKQSFYAVVNDEVKEISLDTQNFATELITNCKEYNITDVEIVGSKNFNQGIKKQVQKKEIEKYNKNELNIILK
jgi:hypothetical protein